MLRAYLSFRRPSILVDCFHPLRLATSNYFRSEELTCSLIIDLFFFLPNETRVEEDFEQVAAFFHRGVTIAKKVKEDTGKIKAYREALSDGGSKYPEIAELKEDVVKFSRGFPVIGFDDKTMRYPA